MLSVGTDVDIMSTSVPTESITADWEAVRGPSAVPNVDVTRSRELAKEPPAPPDNRWTRNRPLSRSVADEPGSHSIMGEDEHTDLPTPTTPTRHSGMFSPRDDPQIVPTAGPGDPLLVGYRPDIDGLRGFGAFLVVWFHFEETWNQSSYKGADLTNSTFFAVSGFVVSLTVLKARRRNAFEFTLKNNCGFALLFLLRRLQRLVMAQLCTTFLTVWVFLAILPPGDRLVRLLDTATYSLIGGANIYFAGLGEEGGGNYLDDVPEETSLSRNPLMHTWYLGLEEQFYLCYPWMFVAAHISKVYLVFGFLAVVSFCFYVRFEEKDPVTAFFMLHCRGWEVLVGVLSCHLVVHSGVSCIRRRSASDERRGIESMRRAVFGPTPISGNSSTNESTLSANKKRRVNWWFLSGQIFAVSTIWYSLYLFWCTTAFCRIIATCFAMSGTAMFFITGHDQDWEKIDTMSITDLNFLNDVSLLNYLYARSLPQYIGRISYALYLWHFPVNVLCAQFRKEMIAAVPFLEFAMIALVFQIFVMTALSVFSYHLIEDPYRRWRADKQGLPSWTPIAIILMFVVILEVVVAHFRGLVRAAVQEAFFERAAHVHTTESRPFVSRNLAVAGIVFFLGGVFVVTLYRFLSGSGSGAEEGATSGSGHPMPLTKRILLRWWKYGCLSLSLSILICWKWSITCGLTLALHLERKEGNSVSSDKDGRGEDNYTENGFGFWEDENFGKQLKVAEIISGFSSRACACRKTDGNLWSSPGAVAPSPGGTTGESVSGLDPQRYPVCFDTDFWKKQARLYGNSVNPEEVRGEWQTCHGNVKSPLPDVDKMWADCHFEDALLGNKHGKNNGDPRRKAFLFGNSHAMALRFAVANALGDHFSVFARSDAYFDKLELFSYLIEESTVEPSAPQGGAGSIEDPKSANDLVERFIDEIWVSPSTERYPRSVQERADLKTEILWEVGFLRRILFLINRELQPDDLVFLVVHPPRRCLYVAEGRAKCMAAVRNFHQFVERRGGLLVLVMGDYRIWTPDESEKSAGFADVARVSGTGHMCRDNLDKKSKHFRKCIVPKKEYRKKYGPAEGFLEEFARKYGTSGTTRSTLGGVRPERGGHPPTTVAFWSYLDQLCSDKICGWGIPGTSLPLHDDAWHLSVIGSSYLAPFLCSFLQEHDLLPKPKQTTRLFSPGQVQLDLSALHAGKDIYWCRVFELPTLDLQNGGFVQVDHNYDPPSNLVYIHHMALFACDESAVFPDSAEAGLKPFRCEGQPFWTGCERMIVVLQQGSHASKVLVLPKNSKPPREQLFLPLFSRRVLLQMHYKWDRRNAEPTGKRPEGRRRLQAQTAPAEAPADANVAPGVADATAEEFSQEQSRFVTDQSSLKTTLISMSEATHLGVALKPVQLFEFGPRQVSMLTIPPNVVNAKVSSVCPAACFAKALAGRKETHFEMLGLHMHAHLATTSMYAEILDVDKSESLLIQPEPAYNNAVIGSPRDGTYELLDPPLKISPSHVIKTTCVHNTTGRTGPTKLGPAMTDEMCFMYALISPLVPGFSHCWHFPENIDAIEASRSSLSGSQSGSVGQGAEEFSRARAEAGTGSGGTGGRCKGICPALPWFVLPAGSSSWAKNGRGVQGVVSGESEGKNQTVRILPAGALPSENVCEG